MSDVVQSYIDNLQSKAAGHIRGTAKLVITGEGTVMLDETGARAGDDEADVTMTADADTFQSILEGELNPTAVFMSGRLKIDGDMGAAMRLGSVLS